MRETGKCKQEINLCVFPGFVLSLPIIPGFSSARTLSSIISISVSTNAISLKLTINSVHDYKSYQSCACNDRDAERLRCDQPVD